MPNNKTRRRRTVAMVTKPIQTANTDENASAKEEVDGKDKTGVETEQGLDGKAGSDGGRQPEASLQNTQPPKTNPGPGAEKHKQEGHTGHSSDNRIRRNISQIIYTERLKHARLFVEKALKQKKIFGIHGPYPVIRNSLRNRGWVEKKFPKVAKVVRKKKPPDEEMIEENDDDTDDDDDDDDGEEEEERDDDPDGTYDLLSRLVRNEVPYFLWTTRQDSIDCRLLRKEQMVNHYARAGSFTTKVGLCLNLRNLHWFDEADPDTFFPRCYRLAAEDDKQAFIEDFWLTAARSILKVVVQKSKKMSAVVDQEQAQKQEILQQGSRQPEMKKPGKKKGGEVSAQVIEVALRACEEFLNSLEHQDIDSKKESPCNLSKAQWEKFLQNYYQVIHDGAIIESSDSYTEQCEYLLEMLKIVTPQLNIEGVQNIWIVKPGAKSRGRGIICMDRLEEMLKLVDCNPTMVLDGKWVVQKYIEKPLLIFGTKFDLRQWFLVTDWNPLTIWFYRYSYIRFASQPFSLDNLDTSIHLCNNSIQKHYANSQRRNPQIPADNMWSSEQFQKHLERVGPKDIWSQVIIPGMKAAVIHAMQTAQDVVEFRKNSFELYGADFMFGEDFQPWLIEINASPTMAPSTAVTSRLCQSVQEDTIRVVIDRKHDRNCTTGAFELICKQPAVDVPQYLGINLMVEGSTVKKPTILKPKNDATFATNIIYNSQNSSSVPRASRTLRGNTDCRIGQRGTRKYNVTLASDMWHSANKLEESWKNTASKSKTGIGKENIVKAEWKDDSIASYIERLKYPCTLGAEWRNGKSLLCIRSENPLSQKQHLLTTPSLCNVSHTEKILSPRTSERLQELKQLKLNLASFDRVQFQTRKQVTNTGVKDVPRMPCLFCKGFMSVVDVPFRCCCSKFRRQRTRTPRLYAAKVPPLFKFQDAGEVLTARGTALLTSQLH